MKYSEIIQNPAKIEEVYEKFFTVDMVDPNFYPIFRKEIFDFFIDDLANKRKMYPRFWELNVFGTWKYLETIDPDDVLDFVPIQVLTATKLGFNVFKEFISYLDSVKLPTEESIKIFYNEFRSRFLSLEEKIGDDKNQIPIKSLIKEVNFLSKKEKNNQEFINFNTKLKEILFFDLKDNPIRKYLLINKEDASKGLIDLIDLFNNIGQERIIEKLEEITLEKITGLKITDLNLKVEKLKEMEKSNEIEVLKDNKEIEIKDNDIKQQEKSFEKTEPKIAPTPPTPTYAEIKAKILQFFPKDENGEIIDTEGVYEVLEKTAQKYNDPKIKELYYFDEESGRFKWSV